MSSGDQTVEVTLRLSKDRYEQIQQAAFSMDAIVSTVEDLLGSLDTSKGWISHFKLPGKYWNRCPRKKLPCSFGTRGETVSVCRRCDTRTLATFGSRSLVTS